MTFPVCVTTGAADELRAGAALMVLGYWLRHREANPVVVLDWGADARLWESLAAWGHVPQEGGRLQRVAMQAKGSQRERHVVALHVGRAAGAAWVVQCDDDVLARPECSIALMADLAGVARTNRPRFGALVARRPYGMVALSLPTCALNHVLDPDAVATWATQPPVAEAGAVGGCRLLATALDPERLPPYDPRLRGYDCLLSDSIRAQGMAVGYFTDASPKTLRATHLCGPLSSVWPYLGVPAEFPRPGGAEG